MTIGLPLATSIYHRNQVTRPISEVTSRQTLGVTSADVQADWKSPSIEKLTDVREARGMTQAGVANLLTSQTGEEMSEDQIHRIENSRDADHQLLARVDQAVDARGYGGPCDHPVKIVLSPRAPSRFSIPAWWQGRIWFAPSEPTQLVFKWGWYRRTVRITESGAAASMLVPLNSQPFEVTSSPPVDHLRVGYGVLHDSHDIADAWMPHSEKAMKDIMQWGQDFAPSMFVIPKRVWNSLFKK